MINQHTTSAWSESIPYHTPQQLDPATIFGAAPMTSCFANATGTRAAVNFSGSGSSFIHSALFELLAGLGESLVNASITNNGIELSIAPELEAETIAPDTIAEKLDQVRDAFGLSMSALAGILGVSRASVYNWDTSEPRDANTLQRIETLYKISQQWREKNPYHYAPGKLMKQKLGDGPSMLDCLSRDKLVDSEIQEGLSSLLALMEKQRQRMDRAKTRSANIPVESGTHKEMLERLTGSVTIDE